MTADREILLQQGKLLPVMETFSSIQGEGYYTGSAAFFIRLSGCDVSCEWCDVKECWRYYDYQLADVDRLAEEVGGQALRAVLITGGEPLMYNLDYLCDALQAMQCTLFLETSGAHPVSGVWNWICLSPKQARPPVKEIYARADELKVNIKDRDDLAWAEKNAYLVNPHCHLFLQPEWSRREAVIPLITAYIKDNSKWRLSLQTHKYINIP